MALGKYLAVPIERFLADKSLARDVFLSMPANGKALRIAVAGDDLRPALLERLRERGYTTLFVSIVEGKTEDPATCALYTSPLPEQAAVPAPAVIEPVPAPAPEEPAAKSTIDVLGETLEGAARNLLSLGNAESSESIMAIGEVLDESAKKMRALEESDEQEKAFKLGEILEEATQKIAETAEEEDYALAQTLTASLDDASAAILKALGEEPEAEVKIPAEPALPDADTLVAGGSGDVDDEVSRIMGDLESEDITTIKGDGTAEEEALTRIAGAGDEDDEEGVTRIKSSKEAPDSEKVTRIKGGQEKPEAEKVTRIKGGEDDPKLDPVRAAKAKAYKEAETERATKMKAAKEEKAALARERNAFKVDPSKKLRFAGDPAPDAPPEAPQSLEEALAGAAKGVAGAVRTGLAGGAALERAVGKTAQKAITAARQEKSAKVRDKARAFEESLEQLRELGDAGDSEAAAALGESVRMAALELEEAVAAEGSPELRLLTKQLVADFEGFEERAEEALAALPSPTASAPSLSASEPGKSVPTVAAGAEAAGPMMPSETALAEDEEALLDGTRAVLTVRKASEELSKLAAAAQTASPEEQEKMFGRMKELQGLIEEVSVSGAVSEEQAAAIGVSEAEVEEASRIGAAEPESMDELYRGAEEARKKATVAVRKAEEKAGREPVTTLDSLQEREFPAVVGRLATYLAVSLGYTDPEFLFELSLGAILHFAQKEGAQLGGRIPMFASQLLNPPEAGTDFVLADAVEILRLLDAYVSNPQCDRTLKDLRRQTLESTFDAWPAEQALPDEWVKARWAQFAFRGPTLEAQGLCQKASARAFKTSKTIVA